MLALSCYNPNFGRKSTKMVQLLYSLRNYRNIRPALLLRTTRFETLTLNLMFYLPESCQPSLKELSIPYQCKHQHCPGVDSFKPSSMRKFAKTSAIPSNLPPQQ